MIKTGTSRWHLTYGTKIFESGIYTWTINMDVYNTSASYYVWGIIDPWHRNHHPDTSYQNKYTYGNSWAISGA